MSPPKRRVAILGSGVGAITTALELTRPGNDVAYEVTIHQLGWRLGGKGASGRNAEYHQRIEEHGAHVWSGIYDNAFRTMREVYAELDRPAGSPLRTWNEAFQPVLGSMSIMEQFAGEWAAWTNDPITNDQLPGDPDAHLLLPFWSYVGEALQLVRRWFRDSQTAKRDHHRRKGGPLVRLLAELVHMLVVVLIEVSGFVLDVAYRVARLVHGVVLAVGLRPLLGLMDAVAHAIGGAVIGVIHLFVRLHWLRVKGLMQDEKVRREWIFLNFAVGVLRGVHRDDVAGKGVDQIEHLDFRAWLSRHIVRDVSPGATPRAGSEDPHDASLTLNSPLPMFLYDADFAYESGDLLKPSLAASVVVYTFIRLGVTWKGSLLWGMHAGMGDVVFGPAYEVLKRRGVRFEFFHKVKALHLSSDGAAIERVTIARQAKLAPGRSEYAPFRNVKGLPSWPSVPHWDQLDDGDRYRRDGVDFEAWYGPELDTFDLVRGRDFDDVVLGISLGGIPYVCGELIEASPDWKAMVDHVATVRTQSAQIWLDRSTWDLGWKHRDYPSVSCFDSSNMNEWVDLSFLVEREDWPVDLGRKPECIAYILGPMREESPPGSRIQTPQEMDQEAHNLLIRDQTVAYLKTQVYRILKDAAGDGSFDWPRLIDDRAGAPQGESRVDSQYFRANVQPTERYVQSLPGTTRYRLHPADSKFENLFLAGDWTWSSFNCGCVEAAVISGMLASHGMCGSPPLDSIVGLTFAHPGTRYAAKRRAR